MIFSVLKSFQDVNVVTMLESRVRLRAEAKLDYSAVPAITDGPASVTQQCCGANRGGRHQTPSHKQPDHNKNKHHVTHTNTHTYTIQT